ncbi:MAG TPA: replicative DNA helicase, partial [Myxococcales bacterium]|nr:replicative DNA helicase [Myxococcales bacterium]
SLILEDFYHMPYQHIFKAIQKVAETGHMLDLVTLGEALVQEKTLQQVGGAAYLTELVDDVGTTAGLEHHISIVRNKSQVRQMIRAATDIASAGYSPDLDLADFMEDAQKKVFEVLSGGRRDEPRHIKEILDDALDMMQRQMQEGGEISGIPTGLSELDSITLGFQNTDLIILAARPAMGKTSLALSIAQHCAVNAGKAAAVFSLEMGSEQLAQRLLAMEAHVNLKDLRGGKAREDDFRRIADAMARLSEAPLYLDDTPAISISELRQRARRLKLQGRCDLLVIDYLQLMRASPKIVSREQQISEISRGLKALAKELNIPVVALSQLNRSLESRTDKRPMLSDLRESGAIEQDADVIMFVYRDEYYNLDSEDKGLAEIIVGKQRNGPTGVAKVSFIAQYTKFANLAQYQSPYPGPS